jgi:hypothetical protein
MIYTVCSLLAFMYSVKSDYHLLAYYPEDSSNCTAVPDALLPFNSTASCTADLCLQDPPLNDQMVKQVCVDPKNSADVLTASDRLGMFANKEFVSILDYAIPGCTGDTAVSVLRTNKCIHHDHSKTHIIITCNGTSVNIKKYDSETCTNEIVEGSGSYQTGSCNKNVLGAISEQVITCYNNPGDSLPANAPLSNAFSLSYSQEAQSIFVMSLFSCLWLLV